MTHPDENDSQPKFELLQYCYNGKFNPQAWARTLAQECAPGPRRQNSRRFISLNRSKASSTPVSSRIVVGS